MKKYLLVGGAVGLALGVLQLLVPYVIVKPCSIGSAVGACGGTLEAVFYRGWPMTSVGGVDIGSRYDQPPIIWQTFANMAVIIAITVFIALALYFISRKVHLSKYSRNVLMGAFVVGIGISTMQLFYIQHETRQLPLFDMTTVMPCEQKVAGCGYCPEAQRIGNFCNLGTMDVLTRGWPLKHETYDKLSHYDISPKLVLNTVIITSSSMFIAAMALVIAKQLKSVRK